MHLKRLLVGLASLFLLLPAAALATPPANISFSVGVCDPNFPQRCDQAGPFAPDAVQPAPLNVSTTSAQVQLAGKGTALLLINTGTSDAYIQLGDSSVTADTTGLYVGAGRAIVYWRGTATYLAAITPSSTTTLVIQQGFGTPVIAGGGGGGGGAGGNVTIVGTLPPYASPPTVNLGTLGGAATAALQSSVQKTIVSTTGNASFIYDSSGNAIDWSTTPPLVAGTAIIGKVGIDQTTLGVSNAVAPIAAAVGGATSFGLQSAASTNSTNVKSTAGTLHSLNLINTTTTIYYLRMYDASAAPTCSSATGFTRTWPIPPASTAGLAGGIAVSLPTAGVAFTAGIGFCLTGGPTSTDNTNAATGVFVNLDYK